MSCDLQVDTDRVREAAALLRRAAERFTAESPGRSPTLGEHAAGGSATAREALRTARVRAEQACQAAANLTDAAARMAVLLDRAGAQFDAAEALCRGAG